MFGLQVLNQSPTNNALVIFKNTDQVFSKKLAHIQEQFFDSCSSKLPEPTEENEETEKVLFMIK